MYELVFLSGARAGAVVKLRNVMRAGRSHDCPVEVPIPMSVVIMVNFVSKRVAWLPRPR